MNKQKSKTILVTQELQKVEMASKEARTGKIARTTSAVHQLQTSFRTAKDQETSNGQKSFLDVTSESLKADHGTDRQMLYKGKNKK